MKIGGIGLFDHGVHFLLKMAIWTGKLRMRLLLKVSLIFFSAKLVMLWSISPTSRRLLVISGSNSKQFIGEFCSHCTMSSQPVSEPNCSSLLQRWKFYLHEGFSLPCLESEGRLKKLPLVLSPQMDTPKRHPSSETSRRLVIILRGSGVTERMRLAMILSNLWTVLKDDSPSWTPISRRCLSMNLSRLSVTPSLWRQVDRQFLVVSTILSLMSVARQVASSGLMPMVYGKSFPVPHPTSQMCLALLSLIMLTSVQQKVCMHGSMLWQMGARLFLSFLSSSLVHPFCSVCIRYVQIIDYNTHIRLPIYTTPPREAKWIGFWYYLNDVLGMKRDMDSLGDYWKIGSFLFFAFLRWILGIRLSSKYRVWPTGQIFFIQKDLILLISTPKDGKLVFVDFPYRIFFDRKLNPFQKSTFFALDSLTSCWGDFLMKIDQFA